MGAAARLHSGLEQAPCFRKPEAGALCGIAEEHRTDVAPSGQADQFGDSLHVRWKTDEMKELRRRRLLGPVEQIHRKVAAEFGQGFAKLNRLNLQAARHQAEGILGNDADAHKGCAVNRSVGKPGYARRQIPP
jgi:hypothetical protein